MYLLLLQSQPARSGYGCMVLIVFVVTLYLLVLRPALLLAGERQLINSVENATTYVRRYHAERSEPFTRSEEHSLIRTIMRRYGLSEQTAATIVADNMPANRMWEPGA